MAIFKTVSFGSILIVAHAVYHTASWQETAHSYQFAWQGKNGEKFNLLQTDSGARMGVRFKNSRAALFPLTPILHH